MQFCSPKTWGIAPVPVPIRLDGTGQNTSIREYEYLRDLVSLCSSIGPSTVELGTTLCQKSWPDGRDGLN